MSPKTKSAGEPGRGPLYLIGGVLLVLVLVGYWYSDNLGSLFERTPDAKNIEGSWVFDAPRAKEVLIQIHGNDQQLPAMTKIYGKAVFTFAPGTITMDNGSGAATPTPCKIQGYPPNAYLVSIGDGKARRDYVFSLDVSKGTKQLFLTMEGSTIPFKPKE